MKRFNSFHSVNVFAAEFEKWEYEVHKHNFYELIFVEEGEGTHVLNDIPYPFKQNDVFLLTPNDAHEFEIKQKIKFIYLQFTEQIFLEKLNTQKKTYWEEALRNVLIQFENTESSIICCKQDKEHIHALLKVMLYEYTNKGLFNNEVILELFGSIMSIVTRNINQRKLPIKGLNKNTAKINQILTYIRIHALDSEKMQIHNMAANFFMSPNYISIFVKKHSGLSIQQHIMQIKLKFAERLLKQKRFTINEVADRLGFNDASHFNKTFKKYKLLSPSMFMHHV